MAGGNFYDPGPYYGFNNSNMEPLDELFYGREEMAPWMDQRRFNPYLQETYPGDRFMDQRRPYMDLESYPGTRFTERIRRPADVEHFVEYEDKFMRYKRPEVRDDTYTAYNGGNQRHMKMRPLSGPRDDSFIEYRTHPAMRPSSGLRDDRWDAHTPPRVQNRSSGSRSQGQHRGFTRMRDGIPIPDDDEELYSYGGNSSGRNFSNEYPSRNLGFDYRDDAVQADQYREHRKSQSNHRFHDDRYETQDYVAPRSHAGRYSYEAGEPIWEVSRLEVMPHGSGHGGQMMASNKSNFVDRDGGYGGQMMNNNNNMKSKSFKDRDGGYGGQMIRNKSQNFVDRDAGYSSAEESYGYESHQHQLPGRYSQTSAKGSSQQYDSRDTDAGMKPSSHGNNKQGNGNSSVVELKVPLCCDNCEKKVRTAMGRMEGVKAVMCDQWNKKVTVVGNVRADNVLKKMRRVKSDAELWQLSKKA